MVAGVRPRSRPSTKTRAPAGVDRTRRRPVSGATVALPLGALPIGASDFRRTALARSTLREPASGADAEFGGAGFGASATGFSVNSRPVVGTVCAAAVDGCESTGGVRGGGAVD